MTHSRLIPLTHIMLASTIKRLGCCGVLVWLIISGVFATFFVGEYITREEHEKSFWKAGVQVEIIYSWPEMTKYSFSNLNSINFCETILKWFKYFFAGYLLCWVYTWYRSGVDSIHIPDWQHYQEQDWWRSWYMIN